jgi:hypothetical protein
MEEQSQGSPHEQKDQELRQAWMADQNLDWNPQNWRKALSCLKPMEEARPYAAKNSVARRCCPVKMPPMLQHAKHAHELPGHYGAGI